VVPRRADSIRKGWLYLERLTLPERLALPGKAGSTWKDCLYLERLALPGKAGSNWKGWFYLEGWLYLERLALPGKAGSTWKG
jgi:hypothetical protein